MPDWAAIAIVIVGVTAFAVAQGLTYPLIAMLFDSRGLSSSLAGLNAACYAAGLAVSTLMLGRLMSLLRGDWLIVAALLGVSFALSTFALFDSLSVWFVARFVLGCSVGIIFTVSEAWLNSACPDRLRGRVSGIYGASLCAGFAAGPLAIPFLGTENGFAFALTAVYVALVAFASALLGRFSRSKPVASAPGGIVAFIRLAPVLALMVLVFGFADIAAISTMPVYLLQRGYSQSFVAFVATMVALPTALTQPLVGWLLDTVSRPVVALMATLVCALAFLVLPLIGSEIALLLTVSVLGAGCFSLYTCALTLLGERFSGGLLVAGSAAYSLVYALGSGLGSGATGWILDLSLTAWPLAMGAILMLFAMVFAVTLRRPAIVEGRGE